MSVVIAFKDSDGDCWLACDAQVTNGQLKNTLSESQNKIFPVVERPGCLIGHVGFLRGINILETNNDYIDELLYLKGAIDYDYVVNIATTIIYELFKQRKFVQEVEDGDATLNLKGETILIAGKQIYLIGADGSVSVIDDYIAIGSGEELALGSLDSTEGKPTVERLQLAVEAAYRNLFCGGDVCIMCDNESKIPDEEIEVENLKS